MYAVVTVWSFEEDREQEQQQGLEQLIVPKTRQAPGFVAGYWTKDPVTGNAHTMIVLETEEDAHLFRAMVEDNAPNRAPAGITLDSLTVTRVIAFAVAPAAATA